MVRIVCYPGSLLVKVIFPQAATGLVLPSPDFSGVEKSVVIQSEWFVVLGGGDSGSVNILLTKRDH